MMLKLGDKGPHSLHFLSSDSYLHLFRPLKKHQAKMQFAADTGEEQAVPAYRHFVPIFLCFTDRASQYNLSN